MNFHSEEINKIRDQNLIRKNNREDVLQEERRKFYIGDWLRGKTAVNTIFKKIGYKNFVSIDSTLQGAPCNKFNLKNTGFDKCITQKLKLTELEINFLKSVNLDIF